MLWWFVLTVVWKRFLKVKSALGGLYALKCSLRKKTNSLGTSWKQVLQYYKTLPN
jgi:hypothetical protein